MPLIKIDLKRIIASAPLISMISEAHAAPLGIQEDARVYYVAGLFLVSSALAFLYFKSKSKTPIEVVSLAYDKGKHKIELTVRNKKSKQYCMKSALRLVQSPEKYAKQNADGSIPLAAAKMSTTDRKLYQLLCEDDEAIIINPNETKTLSYDVAIPQDQVNINADQNVEVSISYGEDKTSLRPLEGPSTDASGIQAPTTAEDIRQAAKTDTIIDGDNAFNTIQSDNYVVAELFLLEELLDAIKKSPPETVAMHMKGQNDFAIWISSVIKDVELAEKLNNISSTNPEDMKKEITGIIESRVDAIKHPYLRKVPEDKAFVLKLDHGEVITEVFLLEELLDAIKNAPMDAIKFHTKDRNDFSIWINDAIGDKKLAQDINCIDYSSEKAKKDLEERMETRIKELKGRK